MIKLLIALIFYINRVFGFTEEKNDKKKLHFQKYSF